MFPHIFYKISFVVSVKIKKVRVYLWFVKHQKNKNKKTAKNEKDSAKSP